MAYPSSKLTGGCLKSCRTTQCPLCLDGHHKRKLWSCWQLEVTVCAGCWQAFADVAGKAAGQSKEAFRAAMVRLALILSRHKCST